MSDEQYLYKLKFEGVHVVWHKWTGPKCEPLGGSENHITTTEQALCGNAVDDVGSLLQI